MQRAQWIARCASRLARRRSDLHADIIRLVAAGLWEAGRELAPEQAAEHEAARWQAPDTEYPPFGA